MTEQINTKYIFIKPSIAGATPRLVKLVDKANKQIANFIKLLDKRAAVFTSTLNYKVYDVAYHGGDIMTKHGVDVDKYWYNEFNTWCEDYYNLFCEELEYIGVPENKVNKEYISNFSSSFYLNTDYNLVELDYYDNEIDIQGTISNILQCYYDSYYSDYWCISDCNTGMVDIDKILEDYSHYIRGDKGYYTDIDTSIEVLEYLASGEFIKDFLAAATDTFKFYNTLKLFLDSQLECFEEFIILNKEIERYN